MANKYAEVIQELRNLKNEFSERANTIITDLTTLGSSDLSYQDRCIKEGVARALTEWKLGVEDDRDSLGFSRIQEYLKDGCDVGTPYTANGDYSWCVCFYAYCMYGIHPQVRRSLFRSTYRLFVYAMLLMDDNLWPFKYVKIQGLKPMTIKDWLQDRPRLVQFPNFNTGPIPDGWSARWWYPLIKKGLCGWNFHLKAGDIIVVNRTRHGPWGNHIGMCISDTPSGGHSIPTIEGNAWGLAPNGKNWEGVVKNNRSPEEVEMVIRPSALDFISNPLTVQFVK